MTNEKFIPYDFKITSGDKESLLWKRLVEHWEHRLAELRMQLENNLSETETAILRGRIKEIKALLDLGKELPRSGTAKQASDSVAGLKEFMK